MSSLSQCQDYFTPSWTSSSFQHPLYSSLLVMTMCFIQWANWSNQNRSFPHPTSFITMPASVLIAWISFLLQWRKSPYIHLRSTPFICVHSVLLLIIRTLLLQLSLLCQTQISVVFDYRVIYTCTQTFYKNSH